MADIEVQKRDERIKQLESVLTRALEYIEAVTVFDPPGTRGVDVAMQLGAILAKAEKPAQDDLAGSTSFSGGITIEKGALTFGHSKCRNLDCALCHGLPPNAGPR
jgi:hypothetical protein